MKETERRGDLVRTKGIRGRRHPEQALHACNEPIVGESGSRQPKIWYTFQRLQSRIYWLKSLCGKGRQ